MIKTTGVTSANWIELETTHELTMHAATITFPVSLSREILSQTKHLFLSNSLASVRDGYWFPRKLQYTGAPDIFYVTDFPARKHKYTLQITITVVAESNQSTICTVGVLRLLLYIIIIII